MCESSYDQIIQIMNPNCIKLYGMEEGFVSLEGWRNSCQHYACRAETWVVQSVEVYECTNALLYREVLYCIDSVKQNTV